MPNTSSRFRRVAALVFALALAACSEEAPKVKPTQADVVGVYLGRYFDGTETVEIRADGTFRQTFVRNGATVYSHEGKWKFTPPDAVALDPFMMLVHYSNKSVVDGTPALSDGLTANFRRDPDRMEFGDWPYLVTKQK